MGSGTSGKPDYHNNTRGDSVTTVMDQRGGSIELPEPLVFSNVDHGLTQTEEDMLGAFRDRVVKRKTEYATLLTDDGYYATKDIRGSRGQVSVPAALYRNAKIFTHTHPQQNEGDIGGTFSDADLDAFVKQRIRVAVAEAGEGRYMISKGKKFDGAGLLSYYRTQHASAWREYNAKTDDLAAMYEAGQMGYSDYLKAHTSETNRYLMRSHNALLAGQKKYGYKYSLGRTK